MNSDIRDQAYQFFREEAPELLQTIETGLLTLRQERDTAEIHQIMRAAHSLKGGAASVGLDPIKDISHRLETIFKALYSDDLTIDDELDQFLLKAFDCLRLPLMQQLTEGTFDQEQALMQADAVLQNLEARLATAIAQTENFIPSASDLGFDIATSIFETDVQQGLNHLNAVLEQPAGYEVAGELRAQAEIFMGFAELLDLSGFARIAEVTLAALDANPDQAMEITRLAIADFQQGREAVLKQGSTTGGDPSAALQAMTSNELGIALEPEMTPALLEETLSPDLPSDRSNDWVNTPGPPSGAAAALMSVFGDLASEGTTSFEQISPLNFADADQELDEVAIETDSDFPMLSDQETTNATDVLATHADSDLTFSNGSDLPSSDPIRTTTVVENPTVQGSALAASLTVRVDTQRLTRLDNQMGELTINRNGLELQNNQLRLGLKELVNRFERMRSTVEQLQAVSDQILIAPERQRVTAASGVAIAQPIDETPQLPGFDSLEMDTYTALYTYTQTLLEDMLQLEEATADLGLFNQQSGQLLRQHRKMLSQAQDELMYARMLPLAKVINRFPRLLRDLSNTYGKAADLKLEGTDLLVEKAVLEKLYDPLMHLLRNGFDHGLEAKEERISRGKPEAGQITIRAYYRGRRVVIEVEDDGRGLELERVRQRVIDLGWLSREEAIATSADQLYRYIFEPGFSTAERVSELSGRGVGLDVVREELRHLRGTVTMQTIVGEGTRFTLSLPMTLSVVNLLICFIGSTPIAFRSDSITEILVPRANQLHQTESELMLAWRDQQVPVHRLNDLLSYHCVLPERPLSQVLAVVPSPSDWEAPLLVLAQEEGAIAIQVDRLVTEQESVIKPFGAALTPPPFAYGCTVLGDGSLIPVLDGQAFMDDLLTARRVGRLDTSMADIPVADESDRPAETPRVPILQETTTILVVDDAVTSRRTLALSLERAGYRVLQARDGQEALEQLQQNSLVEAIVCDIEMPNMNGFEFLTQRRQMPEIQTIPTIMLTSRSNDKHRWLAMQLGASDYFTKPYLEQELLDAIATQLQTANR
ncbi:hybrid sensor histidine kinase/response regulator [Oscillatoria sp. CS-180]|uniref:hybrid sensor histidine kinase/response regulator n=1 Tax=Oscillatoria sp. CS-180 TaxID=3021720 RepID=UPI00232D0972|nr:hybrid sensor histidine kinase/response regulator [Oscillatoria sp. CS-180]MDB9528782.1 hybrid sensor histidine kinase/response regulator [Oscillatoria sp. CS-180]